MNYLFRFKVITLRCN